MDLRPFNALPLSYIVRVNNTAIGVTSNGGGNRTRVLPRKIDNPLPAAQNGFPLGKLWKGSWPKPVLYPLSYTVKLNY